MERAQIKLDGKTLNNVLKAISILSDTANVRVRYGFLAFESLDRYTAVAIRAVFPNNALQYYFVKEEKDFGIDVKQIYDTIKSFNKENIDILIGDNLVLKVDSFTFEFPILPIENDFPVDKIDNSGFNNHVSIETKKLKQIIAILKQKAKKVYNGSITFMLNENGFEILFSNPDTNEKLSFSFSENLIAKNISKNVNAFYSLDYIIQMLGKEFSDVTRIYISDNQILKIVYPLILTFDEAQITFYVAPRTKE